MKRNLRVGKLGLALTAAAIFAFSAGTAGAQENGSSNRQNTGKTENVAPGDLLWRDSRGNGYRGISNQTGMSVESLREWYYNELQLNRNLTFGQFVAANVIGKNHTGLPPQTILEGLRAGKTFGQILRGEGWEKNRIKAERKRLKRELHGKEDYAYRDSGRDWKY